MYERKILDRILDKDNLNYAFKQVKQNKGAPGVDGMTVDELMLELVRNKEEIISQIRRRKYQPSPVLRAEIPKPNGGVRLLGIPTVKYRFLGFGFYKDFKTKDYRAKPHKISVENFKYKLKNLTRRNWSIDTKTQVKLLNQVIRGWINYYKIGSMKKVLLRIDSHLRLRIRMCIWYKWKTAKNRRKNLIQLGMNRNEAYKNSHTSKGIVRIAYSWVLTTTITNKRLIQFGLVSYL